MFDSRVLRLTRHLARDDVSNHLDGNESFGSEELTLAVARTAIVVRGASQAQAGAIRERWPSFVDRSAVELSTSSPFECRLERVPIDYFDQKDCRGYQYDLSFERGSSSIHFRGLEMFAKLDWGLSSGTLWTCTEEPSIFCETVENFLRVLVAYRLCAEGGVLLHSASVLDAGEGEANVFLGHSGAGKTTVSRLALAAERRVPSDDLNLIVGPRPRLLGSPFAGEIGERLPIDVPVRALYRLRKGEVEQVRPLGQARSLACLFSCSPFINQDRYQAESLFENLETVLGVVPMYELTFRKDGDIWPLLEESKTLPAFADASANENENENKNENENQTQADLANHANHR